MPEDARDLDASQLTDAELAAVERAMHAVVSRDADRIEPMLDAARHHNPEDFWMWADDYGNQGSLTLVVPAWVTLVLEHFGAYEGKTEASRSISRSGPRPAALTSR